MKWHVVGLVAVIYVSITIALGRMGLAPELATAVAVGLLVAIVRGQRRR